MNWKRYFTSTIYERGKKYHKDGYVDNLTKTGDTYRAIVYGSRPYHVAITINDGAVKKMKCGCPYAKDGKHCKHMAAVCLEIDEWFHDDLESDQNSIMKKIDPVVKPFSEKNTEESRVYTYFDLSVMTEDITIRESQLNLAKHFVKNKEVVLDNVRIGRAFGYASGDEIGGSLTAYYVKKGVYNPITINFTTEKIEAASCSVRNCSHYYYGNSYFGKKELCEHSLAALLLFEEYIEKHNPGDATNYEAKNLIAKYLSRYKTQKIEGLIETIEDFHFEPRIELGWENLLLSFRVGTSKLYVAKNLTELIENMENGAVQVFGKNLEVDFGIHKVSQESKALYTFVRKIVKEEKQRIELMQRSSHYYEEETIKDTIPLFGSRLDELFELLSENGSGISFQNKSASEKKKMIYMREKDYMMQLVIEGNYDKRNRMRGIIVSGKTPNFFKGEDSYYYIEDDYLNRISGPCMEVMEPLLEMSGFDDVKLEFSRKNLTDFYHHIMPMLSEYVEFIEKEPEIVEQYIPPKACFKFYLDAEQEAVTCDAKVIYGEDEVSLYQLLTEDVMPVEVRDRSAEAEATYHL